MLHEPVSCTTYVTIPHPGQWRLPASTHLTKVALWNTVNGGNHHGSISREGLRRKLGWGRGGAGGTSGVTHGWSPLCLQPLCSYQPNCLQQVSEGWLESLNMWSRHDGRQFDSAIQYAQTQVTDIHTSALFSVVNNWYCWCLPDGFLVMGFDSAVSDRHPPSYLVELADISKCSGTRNYWYLTGHGIKEKMSQSQL